MTAMFPASGVPAADAKNSIPDPATVNCDELWYSTSRCQPRFDPAAANAVLAELINLINKGEVTYDCNFLNQVELSVRYLIQRNLPAIVFTSGVPNAYAGTFDPPVTRYNHGMTFTIIPHQSNTGSATFNANGLGPVPILKGSGFGLLPNDLLIGSPAQITFWNGNFYLIASGVVRSDIPVVGTLPKVLNSDMEFWVRTDGNDDTGDGMFNLPSRAFRTINGCWRKIGSEYIPSPIYTIYIRLGNTGDFEGCEFNGYGGKVVVNSIDTSPSGRQLFRIISTQNANPAAGNPFSICVTCNSMTSLRFEGVSFVLKGYPEGTNVNMVGLSVGSDGNCTITDCDFFIEADNPATLPVWSKAGAVVMYYNTVNVWGAGNRVSSVIFCSGGFFGTASGAPSTWNNHATHATVAGWRVTSASLFAIFGSTVNNMSGPTGVRHLVELNSVLQADGNQGPGDQPGTTSSGGIFVG